jgi:hypothetical protein
MSALTRALREPLVHFLLAGAMLFGAYAAVRGPERLAGDDTTIIVDRRALLTYMQFQANAFEPDVFGAALDGLSDAELAALVAAYVEEEALYREARALGLEASDYVIRRRMVDKVKFLLGDVAAGDEIDEAELASFFTEHRDRYVVAPAVTFTHVFFDAERRGEDQAAADARQTVAELNASGSGFNDASGRGDRFPFLKNYVDRTFDYVASHFGEEFSRALAAVPAAPAAWQGPLRSEYGLHGVLVTRRSEERLPELAEVRGDVERDYLAARSAASLEELTGAVLERYEVELRDLRDLRDPRDPRGTGEP